jgi:peptidoglycan-N-acetylglucosamine deacetylase
MTHEDFSRQEEIKHWSNRSFGLVIAGFFMIATGRPLVRARPARWRPIGMAALFAALASYPSSLAEPQEVPFSVPRFWPSGAEGAVSLTFDDGMPSQLDRAVPILDRLGLKGTFYVTPGYSKSWDYNVERWRGLAANGHELANHTDKHPCSCQNDFRHGGDYCLEKLDIKEIERAIDDAERSLQNLTSLPASARSFAYPCYNTDVGAGTSRRSYVPEVVKRYSAARAGWDSSSRDNDPATVDLSYVFAFAADGQKAQQVIANVEDSLHRGRWAVIVFHGIGTEWNVIDTVEFGRLIQYLANNRHRIWIAPFVEVADYIRSNRLPNNPTRAPVRVPR